MDEKQLNISPELIIEVAKRRRWVILLPFCLALIGGIVYAVVTPRTYEAKTLILVEAQSVPQNYVQPIVSGDTSERISTISQQIMSRTNLEKIAKQFSLFSGPGYENMFMEDKVALLRKNIGVKVITDQRRQTDAFEISFQGRNPKKVTQVLNGLTATFIDQNLKVRESQAIGTSSFLESELQTSRAKLEKLEEKIKEYRKSHMGELPEQLNTNLAILERLQNNLSDRQKSLRESRIRLSDLKNQAVTRPAQVVVIGPGQGARQGAASLDDLIAELQDLQSRYTDQHPDIIRLKKQIAEMESQQARGTGAQNRNASPRISYAMQDQINEMRHEIQATEIEIRNIERQIATYQKRVEDTPKREQDLLSLKRDYQNIQTSYDSLLKRKLEADIAVNMERKQKGEQFKIVDPAKLPERPIAPNMRKVFLLVVAAGLAIGGGLAVLLEFLDTSFRNADDMETAFELPVLATLPMLINPKRAFMTRLNNIGSIAMVGINILLLGVFGWVA
jgi:polysaccharide chain length determinant protein (PEP-CTERM system associated)